MDHPVDSATLLAQAGFFSGLSEASRKALAGLSIVREVRKREVLFMEGDVGHSMYLVAKGAIQLFKTTPDGAEIVIKVVQPGEAFAEVILFEEPRFPVSATSLSASTVLLFPRQGIHQLLERADFRHDFIAMLMRKQRYLASRIYDLTTRDVEERLLMFLTEQLKGRTAAALELSKKDVAAAIGTTPETLSRLIQRLEESGTLSWQGRTVQMLRPAAR